MRLEVIRGPAASGKTTKLRSILANAGDRGAEIMPGEWSSSALHRLVERLVAGTLVTTICIDNCSEYTLQELERICGGSKWPGVTVYAVAECR